MNYIQIAYKLHTNYFRILLNYFRILIFFAYTPTHYLQDINVCYFLIATGPVLTYGPLQCPSDDVSPLTAVCCNLFGVAGHSSLRKVLLLTAYRISNGFSFPRNATGSCHPKIKAIRMT